MIKRFISVTLLICIVSSVITVSANESEQWGFDDFSSESISALWQETSSVGNSARLNTENQNYELNKNVDAGGVGLAYIIPNEITSGKIAFEFTFYMNGTDSKEMQVRGDNASGKNVLIYRFIQNKRPAIRNEESGYSDLSNEVMPKGNRYTFKSVIDFDAAEENITTYINSEESSVKKGFQSSAGTVGLKKINFYIPSAASYTGAGMVIDDFKLYTVDSDANHVFDSYTSLDLGDTLNITDNIELPEKDDINGTSIQWSSSDLDVITDSGVVTRSYFNDETAVLTAQISRNAVTISKKFSVTVLKDENTLSDYEFVQRTKEWLDLGEISEVMHDLTLPVYNSTYDTNIEWTSDNDSVISDAGVVTRPQEDTEVTMTAKISRGAESDTKDFKVHVKRYFPETSDAVSVLEDAGFTIDKQAGQEGAVSITKNMSADAKNIVMIAFDYTLNGEKNKSMNLYVRGKKADGSQFETIIQFICGGYIGLRNQDAVTGKVVYEPLSDKTANDEKHNIKLKYNTLFPGLEVWIDDEKCNTGTYIPNDIYSINSLTWYIPSTIDGIGMQIENVKAEQQRNYEDCIKKDAETLDIGDLDGIKENFHLPRIGEYSSSITWTSSNESMISIKDYEAHVTRPAALAESGEVTLTATLCAGDYTGAKEFVCTLYGLSYDDLGVKDGIANEIVLPVKWDYDGTDILWSSDDAEILKRGDEFFISGMLMEEQSKSIELTAEVKNGSNLLGIKKFNVILENESYYDLTKPNNKHPGIIPKIQASSGDVSFHTGEWIADIHDNEPQYTVDFGDEVTLNSAEIAEYGACVGYYLLEYSLNGSNWETLIDGSSVGSTPKMLSFNRVNAKYIRYSVKEKTPGITGLTEFKVYYRYSDALQAEDNLAGVSLPETAKDNITLPYMGSMGLYISWSSSNTNVITNDGKVTRQAGDVFVNMTATTRKNSSSYEKVFQIKVIGTGAASASGGGGGGGGGSSSGVSIPPVTEKKEPPSVFGFSDIPEDHWAKDYIYKLYSRGIVNGTADNTFEPDRAISRAEFVKLIVEAFDIPKVKGQAFDDVQTDSWYYEYVMSAFGAGIVNGISDNIFEADAMVKRQDMAVILKRLIDFKGIEVDILNEPTEFGDSSEISDYAKESIELLNMGNLMSGSTDNMFYPKSSATRAEASKMIYVIGLLSEE